MRRLLAIPLQLATLCLLLASWPSSARGEETTKPPVVAKAPMTLGALLKARGVVSADPGSGADGFSVPNARLKAKGAFEGGFGYYLQTDFMSDAVIKDVELIYRPVPWLGAKLGLFRSPFSYEFLTSSGKLDLFDRSLVVKSLAPQRLLGAMVEGELLDGALTYQLGGFNGNGLGKDDGEHFIGVGRVALTVPVGQGGRLVAGINGAHGTSSAAKLKGITDAFDGTRTLLGADVRLEMAGFLFATEAIVAWLDPSVGASTTPYGGFVTLGYMITPTIQLIARWETFAPLDGDFDPGRIVGGMTWFAVDHFKLLVDVVAPLEGERGDYQLIVQAETSF